MTLPSHSIWSPVHAKSMSVETDAVDSAGWENSNSASSSRSSSRLELSSIMENEKNASLSSSFPPTSSLDVINTCDVKELNNECPGSWISSRGAHSAPSSPSLVRSRDDCARFSRPVTAQSNSYDDMSDRLWSSSRSYDNPQNFGSPWSTNITQTQSSSRIYDEHISNRSSPSPKSGSFKQFREPSAVNKWSDPLFENSPFSPDVMRFLEQLSLSKYKQTFEVTFNI